MSKVPKVNRATKTHGSVKKTINGRPVPGSTVPTVVVYPLPAHLVPGQYPNVPQQTLVHYPYVYDHYNQQHENVTHLEADNTPIICEQRQLTETERKISRAVHLVFYIIALILICFVFWYFFYNFTWSYL